MIRSEDEVGEMMGKFSRRISFVFKRSKGFPVTKWKVNKFECLRDRNVLFLFCVDYLPKII